MRRAQLPKVRVGRRVRFPQPKLPTPHRPDFAGDPEEVLSGQVNNMKASKAEERYANALRKAGHSFEFRYTIGAPRNMPGWKEIDFVVQAHGLVYAVEMDSFFTHREKARADKLHDAQIQTELNKLGLQVWPTVIHVDGEVDAVDNKSAVSHVKRVFGSSR